MNASICSALVVVFSFAIVGTFEITELSPSAHVVPECVTVLNEFAESSSKFTLCAVTYSHPIQACEMCVEPYADVKRAHAKILTAEVNSTRCRDKLINLDRLEIVESTFDSIRDIWDRGFCDKCFVWTNDTATLSNSTQRFIEYHNVAMECIDTNAKNVTANDTDTICRNCMEKYLRLNSFYESLKDKSETVGICMDIVDLMNATRSIWSDDLDCCKLRRTPELIFLFFSGLFAALPVLFYLLATFYCDDSSIPKEIYRRTDEETTIRDEPGPSTSINS